MVCLPQVKTFRLILLSKQHQDIQGMSLGHNWKSKLVELTMDENNGNTNLMLNERTK